MTTTTDQIYFPEHDRRPFASGEACTALHRDGTRCTRRATWIARSTYVLCTGHARSRYTLDVVR